MPDRRRRAALRLPLLPTPMLRERRPSSGASAPGGREGGDTDRDNPFAAPPEGRPDQEWRPRGGGSGSGSGSGENGDGGRRQQPWGRWSSRQPGRQNDGFGGQRPGGAGGPEGQGGPGGGPGGMRWDPTDPLQRRARYALLAGMWGFFFAIFSLPEIALLLGALAIYWGVSALRGKAPRATMSPTATAADVAGTPDDGRGERQGAPGGRGPGGAPAGGGRPQTSAAISGLVTGGIALAIVAATFAFQLVYRDYYTCVEDALTRTSQQSCDRHLPEQLRPFLSTPD